jgi:hypothetical protein
VLNGIYCDNKGMRCRLCYISITLVISHFHPPTKTNIKSSGQECPLHIPAPTLALNILYTHNLFLQAWDGRTAGEFFEECIADVAQIFDTDFAGEITVGGELAQKGEEFYALPQAGILFRILAIRD